MFKQHINQTPFTSDVASMSFQNINGSSFSNDVSFLSTLRALIAPRMSDNDSIYLHFSQSGLSKHNIDSSRKPDVVRSMVRDTGITENGRFIIVNLYSSNDEDITAAIEVLETQFTNDYNGYIRLDKMTDFFRKSFSVLCFVNPSLKSTIIFVERLDLRKLHYLQCAILAALPWYFDPTKDEVSSIEMELTLSLREKSSDKYLECLNKIAEQYDFRAMGIKQMLDGFESRFDRAEISNINRDIEQTCREIESLNASIGSHLRRKNELFTRVLGLEQKIATSDGNSEMMNYFITNKRLNLMSVNETELEFVVTSYLSYIDKDHSQKLLDNNHSFFYVKESGGAFRRIEPEKMKKLLRAIFIDEILRVRLCAAFRFSLRGEVIARRDYRYPQGITNNHLPNPHIDRHGCMGGYTQAVNDLLRAGEYMMALEQTIASCDSIYWGDPSGRLFIEDLYGEGRHNNVRCIELPDGSIVNSKQAIQWLEEQEAANSAADNKDVDTEEAVAAETENTDEIEDVAETTTETEDENPEF